MIAMCLEGKFNRLLMKDDWLFHKCKMIVILSLCIPLNYIILRFQFGRINKRKKCDHWWAKIWTVQESHREEVPRSFIKMFNTQGARSEEGHQVCKDRSDSRWQRGGRVGGTTPIPAPIPDAWSPPRPRKSNRRKSLPRPRPRRITEPRWGPVGINRTMHRSYKLEIGAIKIQQIWIRSNNAR